MPRTISILLVSLFFMFILPACSAQRTQVQSASAPTQVVDPALIQPGGNLPQSEAQVPRVTVESAKVALESGAAVIVDVRSPAAYAESHVAGAISIPLGEIERNLPDVALDKNQWIITYCT